MTARIAAALLLSLPLCAQWHEVRVPVPEVEVRQLELFGGQYGGYGFVAFEAINHDSVAHPVRFGYSIEPWSGASAEAQREILLAPKERGRCYLPVPGVPSTSVRISVEIDGRTTMDYHSIPDDDPLLVVAATQVPEVAAVAAAIGSRGLRWLDPSDLPPDWLMLSAFDAVLVDGRTGLEAEHQELLRRYAGAGGTLIVGDAAGLRPGPVQSVLTVDRRGLLPVGLGRVGQVEAWSKAAVLLNDGMGQRNLAGAAAAMQVASEIPGIGAVSVRAFLVVILLFAIVVGPVNFLFVARRRQPMLTLVTVPVIGFATTVLILAYGVLHDGFGVQGVVRSLSVLDQQRHECATVGVRTLFAGLSPGRLDVPNGAMLECPQATQSYDRARSHRLAVEVDGRSLDGSALPSRVPTMLVTTQQAPARARLRFSVRGDGGLDALADGAFAPGSGPFLVRDHAGQCYERRGDRLVPCDLKRAKAVTAELAGAMSGLAGDGVWRGNGAQLGEADEQFERLLQQRAVDGVLPPGSYQGFCATAPWLPDLGLAIAERDSRHFVIGLLAAEDFVR